MVLDGFGVPHFTTPSGPNDKKWVEATHIPLVATGSVACVGFHGHELTCPWAAKIGQMDLARHPRGVWCGTSWNPYPPVGKHGKLRNPL